MKAIIPAAGMGTRFLPATKAQPKEMLPIVDKPVIQYVVEEAAAAGITDILIVTGRGKRAIEDHFDRSFELEESLDRSGNVEKLREVREISELAEIFFTRQKRPRGLGHAVLRGEAHVNSQPFFVLLGDVLVPRNDCLPKLQAVYEKHNSSVLAVTPVAPEEVSRYGVIEGHEVEPGVWKVTDLVEKPPANDAPSNLAIFGRYLLTPKVMELLPDVRPGRGEEIQLTDALKRLLQYEDIYATVETCAGYDTGSVLSWLETNLIVALETEEFGPALRSAMERILAGGEQR